MGNDVDLKVKATVDERDAELARLREEVARLQRKRENDENSAFGRLEREAEMRKQRERELEEMRKKVAEFEAAQVEKTLSPEQLEALGTDGVRAVQSIVQKTVTVPPANPFGGDKQTEIEQRIAAMEAAMQADARRRAYSAGVGAYASAMGVQNLLPRLSEGGDLGERWKSFVMGQSGLQQSLDAMDVNATNMALQLFLYSNPDIASPVPTPSQAGGFAAGAAAPAYGMAEWSADTKKLDDDFKAGKISQQEQYKGFLAASAKLAAAQKRQ